MSTKPLGSLMPPAEEFSLSATKSNMGTFRLNSFLFCCVLVCSVVEGWRPWARDSGLKFGSSKRNDGSGSSQNFDLNYHMGPVLTTNITLHTIWYGNWSMDEKGIIKDFLMSLSDVVDSHSSPSVSEWWKTVALYTDQTGANVSTNIVLGSERDDLYSLGKSLTRLTVQDAIKNAVTALQNPLPIDAKNGTVYLLLTWKDVTVQDFYQAACGFHYFTFPSIVGNTLPYAWVGNSEQQCPETCAYPFAVPSYMNRTQPFKAPNGNVGIDGMISVIGHELAEMSSDPLVNAWYGGNDPIFPTEIADVCEGIYGTGGGGGYPGQVMNDAQGASFNLNGGHRKFLVQWLWNPTLNACYGPNAVAHQ